VLTIFRKEKGTAACRAGYLKHPLRRLSPEERLSMPPLLTDAGETGYNLKIFAKEKLGVNVVTK
jgi:hypothetical protein